MDAFENPIVARLLARARLDPDVLAVMLFGSRARGDATATSDHDVCLVLADAPASALAATRKRLDYLADIDGLDIVVFQQLPLHIRSRVLKEGVVLFVRDEDHLYALAIKTVRAFEDFRHIQREYLEQLARD